MIGIIGGSGLAKLVGLQNVRREIARTAWGQPSSALSFGELNGAPVVFTRSGDTYTARRLHIGARDGDNAEVLDGVSAGEELVVAQSYLIKADLEKTSAAHEH